LLAPRHDRSAAGRFATRFSLRFETSCEADCITLRLEFFNIQEHEETRSFVLFVTFVVSMPRARPREC
jgi:hypothetical protein